MGRALLAFVSKELASLSAYEMEPSASWTGHANIFVLGHIRIVVQLMLDVYRRHRANENERCHRNGICSSWRRGIMI